MGERVGFYPNMGFNATKIWWKITKFTSLVISYQLIKGTNNFLIRYYENLDF